VLGSPSRPAHFSLLPLPFAAFGRPFFRNVPMTTPEIGKRYRVECRNGPDRWEADATRIIELGVPKWKLDGYRTKFRDKDEAPADWPWIVTRVIAPIKD
jgi:hypothetical protein